MKHKNNAKKSIHRLLQSMLMPAILMAMSALGIQACDVGHDDEPDQSAHCIPNSTRICNCSLSDIGVQVCQPNGTFEPCVCSPSTSSSSASSSSSSSSSASSSSSSSSGGNCHELAGGGPNCGDGIVQADEECDDGDCNPHNECNDNCRLPFCGDGIVQLGEICDGDLTCGPDCLWASNFTCTNLLFKGFATPQEGHFTYEGLEGFDAATAACKAANGGTRICEYEQWKDIETRPQYHGRDIEQLISAIPIGTCTTAWLQRSHGLTDCPAGIGGNCGEWTSSMSQFFDGELVTICNDNGALTFSYKLDCDPIYDPMNPNPHNDPGLDCTLMRAIPCCTEACISP